MDRVRASRRGSENNHGGARIVLGEGSCAVAECIVSPHGTEL